MPIEKSLPKRPEGEISEANYVIHEVTGNDTLDGLSLRYDV